MARLSIHTLGSFYVTLDGEPVTTFESNKVRALLVFLAAEADHPHSRDSLVGSLWPDQPDRFARRSLSQALFNLRQAIGDEGTSPPFLHVTRQTVQFNQDSDYWLDIVELESQLTSAQQQAADLAVRHWACASDLYRGEFLAGFFVDGSNPFAEWAMLRRERFHRQVLDIQYQLTKYHERHRDYERACHYARRQVELEPWREEAHQQLMKSLARGGQRSAALAQYDICRRILAEQLAVEPSEETEVLYRRLRAIGTIHLDHLPLPPTDLIGREQELAHVAERLEDPACRLLTLLGPGGIGKTRLAIQAAREARDLFLHGVYFVALAPLSSTDFLASAVAATLGFQFHGSREPWEQVVSYLAERELLLVMDGFEHLLPGAAYLGRILKSAPGVKILVTSQQRLRLRAEWLLDISGLTYPPQGAASVANQHSAVQLFLQHANRVRAGFALSERDEPYVIQICSFLEGVPLAIELASAWVRTLSCEQIVAEMQRDPDFLATDLQDVDARHQSLRAVFQHSWQLLSEGERGGIARLSVFYGSFSRQAARAVTGATTAILSALVDKSLLRQTSSGQYDLHALVKRYAAEKLTLFPADRFSSQDLHCGYYTSFCQQREQALKGEGQAQARAEIQAVIADVRAAWEWAVDRARLDLLSSALESIYLYYRSQAQYREGREMLNQAAVSISARQQENDLLQARIGVRLADFHCWLGEYDRAHPLIHEGLQVLQALQSTQELAFALEVLGRMESCLGEYAAALSHLEASAAAYRQVGDRWGLAQALNHLGNVVASVNDDYEKPKPFYEESLSLSRQIGDQAGMARALLNLGALEYVRRALTEAQRLYQQSATISREIGDARNLAICLGNLGQLAYHSGEYESATELIQESLHLKRQGGDPHSILYSLSYLGNLARKMGRSQEARRWYREALELAASTGAVHLQVRALIGVAKTCIDLEHREQAAQILEVALNHTGGDRELIGEIEELLSDLATNLAPDVLAACRQRGRASELQAIVAEILSTQALEGGSLPKGKGE